MMRKVAPIRAANREVTMVDHDMVDRVNRVKVGVRNGVRNGGRCVSKKVVWCWLLVSVMVLIFGSLSSSISVGLYFSCVYGCVCGCGCGCVVFVFVFVFYAYVYVYIYVICLCLEICSIDS